MPRGDYSAYYRHLPAAKAGAWTNRERSKMLLHVGQLFGRGLEPTLRTELVRLGEGVLVHVHDTDRDHHGGLYSMAGAR